MNEILYNGLIIFLFIVIVLCIVLLNIRDNDRAKLRIENTRLLQKVLHLEYFLGHLGKCDVGKVKELYKNGTTTIPYPTPPLPYGKEDIEIHIIHFRKKMSVSIK
jgi:hypothetical protein